MTSAAGDERVRRGMAAQLGLRARRLEAGARPVGWKVGLNPPAAQQRAGIDGPVAGFLTDATVLEPGSSYSIGDGKRVVVEPEVAVRLGADVPAVAGADAARAAIAAAGPALEIVEIDRDVAEIEAVLAGDIFHRAVVFGEEHEGVRDVTDVQFRVLKGERTEGEGDAGEAAGDLGALLAHVARFLHAHGAALRAGDRVICGALVTPLAVAPGDRVVLDLGGLGTVDARFEA